jgi:GntR family transcriptional regulator/MocR family aminotransferase
VLRVDLRTREGRDAVEAFFARQVPSLAAAPKLVQSREGHFMDKPDNVMSCINLATLRSLEQQWGYPIHPLRFRANFYIDGARPWEEFDWIGSDIMLGDVLFRVDRRNGRCGAVNVNPVTGERDLDLPGALRKAFGHKDIGVYLVARKSGKVVVGDQVVVPEVETSANGDPAFVPPPAGQGSFICRGCYYIYEESRGVPGLGAGTSFSTVGKDWRCPDCGTEKANFRPYVAVL